MPKSSRNISLKIWVNLVEILFQLKLGFLEVYLRRLLGMNFLRIGGNIFKEKRSISLQVLREKV
jgi:hypothetical protein